MFNAAKYIPGLGKKFGIARTEMVPELLAPHGISLTAIKNSDGSTIAAGGSGASGAFTSSIASHAGVLIGQVATSNTKTSTGVHRYVLPDNYVPGGGITVRVTTKLLSGGVGPVDNGSDLTVAAYLQANGAVGSNLGPVAQVYAAVDTYYVKTFVITPTGLVAGSVLNLEFIARAIESGGGNLQSVIGEVSILHDVRG